MDSWQQLAIFI